MTLRVGAFCMPLGYLYFVGPTPPITPRLEDGSCQRAGVGCSGAGAWERGDADGFAQGKTEGRRASVDLVRHRDGCHGRRQLPAAGYRLKSLVSVASLDQLVHNSVRRRRRDRTKSSADKEIERESKSRFPLQTSLPDGTKIWQQQKGPTRPFLLFGVSLSLYFRASRRRLSSREGGGQMPDLCGLMQLRPRGVWSAEGGCREAGPFQSARVRWRASQMA